MRKLILIVLNLCAVCGLAAAAPAAQNPAHRHHHPVHHHHHYRHHHHHPVHHRRH